MANHPAVSLSQLQTLLAIVETGSFTAAAKKLNRATSVITYTIDTLEAQLGLALFNRGTARRAKLTKEGELVVAEARSLVRGADRLRARVNGLRDGLEAEVSLTIDEILPVEQLTKALAAFAAQFPTVPVRLQSETLGGVEHLVRTGRSAIGLGGAVHIEGEGLIAHTMPGVAMIPVAVATHPLARGSHALEDARQHLQVVVTERYNEEPRQFGVVGEKQWKVTSFAAKLALLRAGIGWGGMPEPMIGADLRSGKLVQLNIAGWSGGEYVFQLIHRSDAIPGQATQWLIDHFLQSGASR